MQSQSLSGKTTELYTHTKRTVDLLNKEILDQIIQWRMFSAKWEITIKDYFGKEISYKGIAFSGSPVLVFWEFFPPFFEHEIPKVLNKISDECKAKNLKPEEYVSEAASLLKIMVNNLWHEIAKTDQLLRGNGFPESQPLKDVSGRIKMAQLKIDEEVKAVLLQGTEGEKTSLDNEDMVDIKPNFYGIGINFNAVFRWLKNKCKGM